MSEQGLQKTLHVCLPAYDDIDPMTVNSLFELRQQIPFTLDMIGVAEVAVARTMLLDRVPKEVDYILWLDADMVFAPQHFFMLAEALTKSPQMGLVSGLAVRRDGSNLPCVNWRKGKKDWCNQEEMVKRVIKYTDEEAVKSVDVTGLAFSLMDTSVTKKLKKPIFHPRWVNAPGDVEEDSFLFYGEDSDFMKKLKDRGYDPSCHFGCHVGHIGKKVYVPRPPQYVIEEHENGKKQPDAAGSEQSEVRGGSEVPGG